MNEKQASVAARIADLACLPMSEFWAVWDRYFPRHLDYLNRTHVESRIAYKLSSDERLDQKFNSIDAQKEAGHAFVASQHAEG